MDERVETTRRTAGRFLPASQLDFSRYAKSVAWLLDMKAQASQELLSRIYGYEHLHELQQALKTGGMPGPYWDEGPDESEDWKPEGLGVFGTVPGERSRRAADVLIQWKRSRGYQWHYLEGNERFICELGLTDSPTSHRACVRRVKAFLDGKMSVDERGFPCGIWAFVFDYRLEEEESVGGSVWKRLMVPDGQLRFWSGEGPLTPREQLLFAVKDRSVRAMATLCEGLQRVDLGWHFGFEGEPCHWESMWDVIAHPDMIQEYQWITQCSAYAFNLDSQADEDEQEARCNFIRWPCARRFKACSTQMSMAEVIERVSQWRMSWMLEAAEAWSRSRSGVVLLSGMIFDESRGGWTGDFGTMDVVLQSREVFDSDGIEHYSLVGTLSKTEPDNESCTAETKIIGCVQGSYVVPCKANRYVDEEGLQWFLEGHEFVAAGWKIAERYMNIVGVPDMESWVNDGDGCGVLIVRLAMTPEFDTDEWRGRVVEALANSFADDGSRYTSSTDASWKDDLYGTESLDEDEDLIIETPGIVIASVPGLNGIGIAFYDGDAVTKQIVVLGQDVKRPGAVSRYARRMKDAVVADANGTSTARAILQAARSTLLDLAVFDADAG
jgi:hypothetical protein